MISERDKPFTGLRLIRTGHARGKEIFDNSRLYNELIVPGEWDVNEARRVIKDQAALLGNPNITSERIFDLYYTQVTGVEKRCFAGKESVESLAIRAAENALEGGERPNLVIVPNFTDPKTDELQKIPNTGLVFAHKVGNDTVPAFSVNSKHGYHLNNLSEAFSERGYNNILNLHKHGNGLTVTFRKDGKEFTKPVIGDGFEAAVATAKDLLKQKDTDASDLELVIFSSLTEDDIGSAVSRELGLGGVGMSINTACAGFAYGCALAEALAPGQVLVSAAEKMSDVVDFADRKTCALFGDAAGAALLEITNDKNQAIDVFLASKYSESDIVLGTREADKVQLTGGMKILRKAVNSMKYVSYMLLLQQFAGRDRMGKYMNYTSEQIEKDPGAMKAIDYQIGLLNKILAHDANERIIRGQQGLAKEFHKLFGLPDSFFYSRIRTDGNCSCASSIKNLDCAIRKEILKPGNIVLMPAVGGGYSSGAVRMVVPSLN